MAAPPVPRLTLPNYTREDINTWFELYDISFKDPNFVCEKMCRLREGCEAIANDPDLSEEDKIFEQSGAVALWGILKDIAAHPAHRHRIDAQNIIKEVEAREAGEDPSFLICRPQARPYTGPDQRYPPYPPLTPNLIINYENFERRMPKRKPNDPLPVPRIRPPPLMIDSPAPVSDINDALFDFIQDDNRLLERLRQELYTNLHEMLLTGGGINRPIYRDDPDEDVLDLPEDIPFLNGPTAPHDPTLLDQKLWPPLEVYDFRLGDFQPLKPTNYIYKLFSWCRFTMARPDVARKYCIIFRANPRRYRDESFGELDGVLEEEDEPSSEELNAMIGFITKAMPIICVDREDQRIEGALGYHSRYNSPTKIFLNGEIFDGIEKLWRDNCNPAALIYGAYITFLHECGHYYNTCIHSPDNPIALRTPRRIRFLVSHEEREFENHKEYNPWNTTHGEMGEMIEWLIFGGYTVLKVATESWQEQYVWILVWDGNLGQGSDGIGFDYYVAERLLPTVARLNGLGYRLFIQRCKQERDAADQRAFEAEQAAEQAARQAEEEEEEEERDPLPRAGDGTASGIIDFMDDAMDEDESEEEEEEEEMEEEENDDGDGDDEMDEADEEVFSDEEEDEGDDYRMHKRVPTAFIDADEQFTGHTIGSNMQYRRAVWRVNREMNQNDHDQGFPLRKVFTDRFITPNSWEVPGRDRIIYRSPDKIPLVAKLLPENIKPWTLMLGMLVYGGIWLCATIAWELWCPKWLAGLPSGPKMAHKFCAAMISFVILTVPFRRLLEPFGTFKPARYDYFEWKKTVEVHNPYLGRGRPSRPMAPRYWHWDY